MADSRDPRLNPWPGDVLQAPRGIDGFVTFHVVAIDHITQEVVYLENNRGTVLRHELDAWRVDAAGDTVLARAGIPVDRAEVAR